MRLLVTGGAGYIGSHATRLFLERGHQVCVVDNLVYGHAGAVPKETLRNVDLADGASVREVLADFKPDAVVHFAAFAYVGESVTDPAKYYQNNFRNALDLIDSVREAGVKKFVFSSTCATYGVPGAVPIAENQNQSPINPYGRTKLMVEWVLEDYCRAYGIGYAALRYFNASGAHPSGEIGEDHQPETHLIPLILQVALGQRAAIDVFGTDYPTPDGTCIRDYIHVDDLAEAHLLSVDRLAPGTALKLNLGTGKGFSVREVIGTCERVSGEKIAVREVARREGDPPELVAAAGAAKRELGWTANYQDLEKIVSTAWKWHSSHPQGYDDRKK